MQSILAVVIVLGLLIAFHELGHFLVARMLGIGVKVFSIGFPPKLISFKKGQTQYRLSLLPLGGYVQLVGENREDDLPEGFTRDQSFMLRPAWHRMLVVAAGPVFNFILAMLIYWGVFWSQGMLEVLPIVGEVRDDSPAMEAGLQQGDHVVAINGQEIDYWRQLASIIGQSEGQTLSLTVDRDGAIRSINVSPKLSVHKNIFGEEIKTPLIGITASGQTKTIPLGGASAAWEAVVQTWHIIKLTGQSFMKIIERVIPLETVGGPILIVQMVSEQANQGLANLLALTALISINLGLINLLPIPVLDGGHILFFGVESVTGRPVPERIQELTTKIGLALLIMLMLLATYNDLQRHFPWLSFY